MPFTDVFGGSTIYPADVSYLALALPADVVLEWPLQNSGDLPPAARIIDVDPTANGFTITLPNAEQVGAGQTILFNNVSGSYSFTVEDADGVSQATVAFGTQWQLYLAETDTPGGTWRVYRMGASTATVQPSQIAGYGLIPTGATLSQSMPVTTFTSTGLSLTDANRAGAFIWKGTGTGTLNLPLVGSVGNNYFVAARNSGGGDLTIDPNGSETINGASTLALRPGDSVIILTDGTAWYTLGYGQQAVFAFDYTAIAVTGGTYTLSGSELNRIAYKFTGVLSSDLTVVVPATVQQYWIWNATTGPYDMYVKTPGNPPAQVNQGAKGIYYSDGTNLILASDPTTLTTPIVISDGGTGAVTASAARLNLGITAFADSIVTAANAAAALTALGAAKSGANNDITSLAALTTPISLAQGGTGGTSAATARTSLDVPKRDGTDASGTWAIAISGNAATATTAAGLSGTLPVASGGTGSGTAGGARTNLDVQQTLTSGTNIKTVNGNSLLGSGDIDVSSAPFPSGTIMLFGNTAAPTGWTKLTDQDNAALRIVSGSVSTGGSVNFTTAFASQSVSGTTGSTSTSGTVGSTTLTESQMPSHTHYTISSGTDTTGVALTASNQVARSTSFGGDSEYVLYGSNSSASLGNSSSAGSSGSHTHSFTGSSHTHSFSSSAINLAVKYVDFIRASKT